MRFTFILCIFIITCNIVLGEENVESAAVVETSGWANSDETSDINDISSERALSSDESGLVNAENPYPELDWPRAGGAIFDPAGGMYLEKTEVLLYSLMGTGALVHYTTDGTEPTNKSTTFETKIKFEGVGDYVLKACVSAPEKRDSVVVEQIYRVRTTSAAPSITAAIVDFENPESGNTTHANNYYLGSFEEGVRLTFYTSTPNSDIKYTFDNQVPTDDYGNITVSGMQIILNEFGNHTIKAKTFPRQMSGFPSEIVEYKVEVHKRPPRPAYTFRREKIFLRDMENKYNLLSSNLSKKVLNPPDLETYIVEILNPDNGMCDDCHVTPDELELIKDATYEMKRYEGLSTDDELLLYPGFLMRGSPHRFIHRLNTKLREYRWKVRNGTLALPPGQEHSEEEMIAEL
jgi:hypothetical protein